MVGGVESCGKDFSSVRNFGFSSFLRVGVLFDLLVRHPGKLMSVQLWSERFFEEIGRCPNIRFSMSVDRFGNVPSGLVVSS